MRRTFRRPFSTSARRVAKMRRSAGLLKAYAIPFMFYTGYHDVHESSSGPPIVTKPASTEKLIATIAGLLDPPLQPASASIAIEAGLARSYSTCPSCAPLLEGALRHDTSRAANTRQITSFLVSAARVLCGRSRASILASSPSSRRMAMSLSRRTSLLKGHRACGRARRDGRAGRLRHGPGEGAARRAACRRARPRPDLDHADHRQHPRHAGLRHAVRQRRRHATQAADGRQGRHHRGQARLYLHAARQAEIPRRLARHQQRRDRLARPLGQEGRRRPAALLLRRQGRGGRRQDLPHDAQEALRHGAGVARQDQLLGGRHHARPGCGHRPAAAGEGGDRLGSLQVRQGPVGAGQQGRLSQERRLCVAAQQREGRELRRLQVPRRRPHRAGVDLRPADRHVGAHQRRDRLLREPQHRLLPDPGEGQGREADAHRQARFRPTA